MTYRLRKYVGAYAVALGRLDALVFTGGIGEHGYEVRAAVIGGLGLLRGGAGPSPRTAPGRGSCPPPGGTGTATWGGPDWTRTSDLFRVEEAL